MARYIILTASQAIAVRGTTVNGAALDPIAILGGPELGRFALPERVLDDADHASRKAVLAARWVIELNDDIAFPSTEEPALLSTLTEADALALPAMGA